MVLTPAAVFGIVNEIAPEDTALEAGILPPVATKFKAGPVGQILPKPGVIEMVDGVLARN